MNNIRDLISGDSSVTRYERQIARLRAANKATNCIDDTVQEAVRNINDSCRSFVIYGEPQSGKTEMMIALTAKLLDEGFRIVIILLTDNVPLLSQNLERFRRSGIDPAPKNFTEILDSSVTIGTSEWVIFCKKNSKDLKKLLQKVGGLDRCVTIDDEADFASPNSRINRGEKTTINKLIEKLFEPNGLYIGVTATPARLDLNNTFRNENERWVDFAPHQLYTGQKDFFPTSILSNGPKYDLVLLPNQHDAPQYLRSALFRFLVKVAHLNLTVHPDQETNYCILIHTSGKRADHTKDYHDVVQLFNILRDKTHKKFERFYEEMWDLAKSLYSGEQDDLIKYIYANRNRNTIVVMNSDTDKSVVDYTSATDPSTLFTVAIGGNIVSRGVTFNNLLSMFFTRDVKHKIQQDTYIQRARMFGSRGHYLSFMELHIPQQLYLDWHRCFVFHRLSLEAIRAGKGSPVWLEDRRVKSVATSSIDKTTVAFDSGEMSFEMFDYCDAVDDIIIGGSSSSEKIRALADELGDQKLPQYLLEYIAHFSPAGPGSLAVHRTGTITKYEDADKVGIARPRGFIGSGEMERKKFPDAIHHIKIFKNAKGQARVFYKLVGNIRFLKNMKKI